MCCTALTRLDLSHNHLTVVGATTLVVTLLDQLTATLRDLCLAHNSLGNAGTVAVAAGVRANASLRRLDVSANAVGDEGVVAIADALTVRLEEGAFFGFLSWLKFHGPLGLCNGYAFARSTLLISVRR
jgi:hypothetical protein